MQIRFINALALYSRHFSKNHHLLEAYFCKQKGMDFIQRERERKKNL